MMAATLVMDCRNRTIVSCGLAWAVTAKYRPLRLLDWKQHARNLHIGELGNKISTRAVERQEQVRWRIQTGTQRTASRTDLGTLLRDMMYLSVLSVCFFQPYQIQVSWPKIEVLKEPNQISI